LSHGHAHHAVGRLSCVGWRKKDWSPKQLELHLPNACCATATLLNRVHISSVGLGWCRLVDLYSS